MLYRIAAVAALACVLSGCTDADWDRTFSYVGVGDSSATAAPAKPAPTATAPTTEASPQPATRDDWCDAAAKSAAQESRAQGFDEATQRHQSEVARAQCLRH